MGRNVSSVGRNSHRGSCEGIEEYPTSIAILGNSVPTESGSLQVLLHLQDQNQKQNFSALLQNYSVLLLLQMLLVLLLLLWLKVLLILQVLLL